MTEAQKKRARKLREKGLIYREIGKRLGVSTDTAWRACNPERASVIDARRAPRRREYDRHYSRTEAARGRCPECGGLLGIKARGRPSRCVSCVRRGRDERWNLIERLWASGKSLLEIAAAVGMSKNQLGVDIHQMRAAGRNLPYRYRLIKPAHPDLARAA